MLSVFYSLHSVEIGLKAQLIYDSVTFLMTKKKWICLRYQEKSGLLILNFSEEVCRENSNTSHTQACTRMCTHKQPTCLSTTPHPVFSSVKWEANFPFMLLCHRLLLSEWRISHLDVINCCLKYSCTWKSKLNSLTLSTYFIRSTFGGRPGQFNDVSYLYCSWGRDTDFSLNLNWWHLQWFLMIDFFFLILLAICIWFWTVC